MRIYKLLIIFVNVAVLSSCSLISKEHDHSNVAAKDFSMSYIDSAVFDKKFSQLLEGEANSISIDILGDVSINDVPTRLKVWLDESTSNGSVLAMIDEEDIVRDRGLLESAVEAVYEYYGEYRYKAQFNNTAFYDIDLVYEKDSGTIKKIIYKRKK